MTDQHPISPPSKLRHGWRAEAPIHWVGREDWLMDRAAQWGADQELEACCEWLHWQNLATHPDLIPSLRAARRPKPPSAIEQAESLIERHQDGWVPNPAQWHVIREGLAEGRRALEALPDD